MTDKKEYVYPVFRPFSHPGWLSPPVFGSNTRNMLKLAEIVCYNYQSTATGMTGNHLVVRPDRRSLAGQFGTDLAAMYRCQCVIVQDFKAGDESLYHGKVAFRGLALFRTVDQLHQGDGADTHSGRVTYCSAGWSGAVATQHAFLLRWLTVAYKQKRFPRAIASDIESMVVLGRQKGLAAGLFNRLEYLWVSCTGPVTAQSDLYRLTYVIEQLKSEGWVNAVVSDREWGTEALTEEYRDINALLVGKSALTDGFLNEGKLIAPIEFLVTGDLSSCMAVFQAHAIPVVMQKPDRIAIQP